MEALLQVDKMMTTDKRDKAKLLNFNYLCYCVFSSKENYPYSKNDKPKMANNGKSR